MQRSEKLQCYGTSGLTAINSDISINIGILDTNSNLVAKIIQGDPKDITHDYDVWHVVKNKTKKLSKSQIKQDP